MNSATRHSLLLVDDHPLMRRGLRQLLELEADFQVVGEASNGEEALQMQAVLTPALIVLDNNMPQMNGIETLKRLRQAGYSGKILLYTVSDAEEDVRNAMRHGADGYLLKDMEPEDLIAQVRAVLAGNVAISTALAQVLAKSLRAPAATPVIELTLREREVLRMIVGGNSNKMIGHKLGITEGTVKIHVKNLLHKLGFRSRVEAVVWALENLKT